MLDFIRFVIRNRDFFFKKGEISSLGVRDTREYRKAMREYLREHPFCEFCGRDEKVDVHHKIPVSMAPQLASDKGNMATLCRKPQCHFRGRPFRQLEKQKRKNRRNLGGFAKIGVSDFER